MAIYAVIEDRDGNWLGVEPVAWPYPTTEDINEARRWASSLAQQNGEPYALYYRGHEGGQGTGRPWADIWGVAPLAFAEGKRVPQDLRSGPCEIYQPNGDRHMVTIF